MLAPPVLPDIIQRALHGPVRIVGVRAHGGYVLAATGPPKAILWLFPEANLVELHRVGNGMIEHRFDPTAIPSPLLQHLLRDLETWQPSVDRRIDVTTETRSSGVGSQTSHVTATPPSPRASPGYYYANRST